MSELVCGGTDYHCNAASYERLTEYTFLFSLIASEIVVSRLGGNSSQTEAWIFAGLIMLPSAIFLVYFLYKKSALLHTWNHNTRHLSETGSEKKEPAVDEETHSIGIPVHIFELQRSYTILISDWTNRFGLGLTVGSTIYIGAGRPIRETTTNCTDNTTNELACLGADPNVLIAIAVIGLGLVILTHALNMCCAKNERTSARKKYVEKKSVLPINNN